jgi:Major Facilitator Superfamily
VQPRRRCAPMSPRAAITTVFFVDGALFASWASRIPALSERVGATTGQLGLALLTPAVAALIAIPLVGRLLPGRSSRTFCRLALIGLVATIPLPGLARNVPELGVALLLISLAASTLDIAMNAQGLAVEGRMGRPIFSSVHAAFSFGGFAGAGIGALAAALGIAPLPHLAFAALVFGIPGLIAGGSLLVRDENSKPRARGPRQPLPWRLILIGCGAFLALLAEGGASDWSAKLVRDDLGGSAALGALAYAAFSLGMAGGRLIADRLFSRWGSTGLLRRSGAFAALTLGACLAVGTSASAIAGFGGFGLGLAGVVPTLFRAGGSQPGVSTGPGLAVVSSLGYLGLLVGPPIIGGLAQLTSLRLACVLLVLAGMLVVALAPYAAPSREAASDPSEQNEQRPDDEVRSLPLEN